MEIQSTEYYGNPLRYVTLRDKGILFSNRDVRHIVGIGEETGQEPDLDLAGAVLLANSYDPSFSLWLQKEFSEYNLETLERPQVDWK